MLDQQQVDKCRAILDSSSATNFESRMVAELHLYWIIYRSCSPQLVDLPKAQADLFAWKNEWKDLLGAA